MSLQPQAIYCVPEETARVARTIFPAGNLVMRIYDELDMLVGDADFADLFATQGQPAEAPARLALVTLLQFWEGLTDRQAADAVRTRNDWKRESQSILHSLVNRDPPPPLVRTTAPRDRHQGALPAC